MTNRKNRYLFLFNKDLAECLGASAVGIATNETLAGGPPSVDLTYVLPKATSAVSFLVALDQRHVEPYLRKVDRTSYELDNVRTNTLVSGISMVHVVPGKIPYSGQR